MSDDLNSFNLGVMAFVVGMTIPVALVSRVTLFTLLMGMTGVSIRSTWWFSDIKASVGIESGLGLVETLEADSMDASGGETGKSENFSGGVHVNVWYFDIVFLFVL